jgi:hypothetical protein
MKGKGLYINLTKSITRDQAKKVHGKLPDGGEWKTVKGHHVYIVKGKIVAGAWGGAKGDKPQKSTKAHIAELQAHLDKKVKTSAPVKAVKKPSEAKEVKASTTTAKKSKKGAETISGVLGYNPVDGKKKVKAKVKAMEAKAKKEKKAIK